MTLVLTQQKLAWPEVYPAQHVNTPTLVGATAVESATHRVHGRIIWDDGATHTPSVLRFHVRTITAGRNLQDIGGNVVISIQSKGASVWADGATNYGTFTRTTNLSQNAVNQVTLGSAVALPHLTPVQIVYAPAHPPEATGIQKWEIGGLDNDVAFQTPTHAYGTNSVAAALPVVLVESADGHYGILEGGNWLSSEGSTVGFKNSGYDIPGDDPDLGFDLINEYGAVMTPAFDARASHVFVNGAINSGVTAFELAVATLNGSNIPTLVHSQAMTRADYGSSGTTAIRPGHIPLSSPISVTAGARYVITLRNLSADLGATETMFLQEVVFGDAAYQEAICGGTDYGAVKRAGGVGAFVSGSNPYTVETDRCRILGFLFDQIHATDAGGGGATYSSTDDFGNGFAG